MPVSQRQRKLLRLAWALPVLLLLCGLQLGWLDPLLLRDSQKSDSGGEPAPPLLVALGRRDLTDGGSDGARSATSSGSGSEAGGDSRADAGQLQQCDGPFDVPKVLLLLSSGLLSQCLPC